MPSETTSDNSLSQPENSPVLAGECVAFTGRLASMTHRAAAELVEENGGRAVQSVSGMVSMLVIGEEGWPLEENGDPSQKLLQTTDLIAHGAETRILTESDWLHLIGLDERRDEIHRSYTPAMLSRMLEVPVGLIRRWWRIGLINPVRLVCRLPYFDYREVTSAQRLARLLDEGIKPEVLERSLTALSHTIAETDRSLAQLNLLVQDEKVLLRDSYGVLNPKTGQRLLDFTTTPELSVMSVPTDEEETSAPSLTDGSPENEDLPADDDEPIALSFVEARLQLDDRDHGQWSADDWFNEGCRLAEEESAESSINAFRNCLSLLVSDHALLADQLAADNEAPYPDPADVHFHLADALYRQGKIEAAIERYHCAIEFAPDFIEAWTQLGCLQTENSDFVSAEFALQTAIAIHDANPDALLHYAQLLDQQNRPAEALEYWEKYLKYDSRGPWADHARERLQDGATVLTDEP